MNIHRTVTPAAKRAFTLIELMVVIAIIGLLVAILLPTFDSVRNKARQAKVVAQFQAIDQGLNLFQNESALGGSLPPSSGDQRGTAGDFQVIKNPRKVRGGNGGKDDIRVAGAHLLAHALLGADQLGPPGFRDLNHDGRWWNDTSDDEGGLYEIDKTTGQVKQTRYGTGGFVDDKMKDQAKSLTDLENKGIVLNLAGATTDLATDELMFVDAWDMPILYYRANGYNVRMTTDKTNKKAGVYRQEDNGVITGTDGGIVNADGVDFGAGKINDHYHAIAVAESPEPVVKVDFIQSDPSYDDTFARFILDGSIATRPTPVRKDSFLLISAGPDARYGTEDDMTNWTRESK